MKIKDIKKLDTSIVSSFYFGRGRRTRTLTGGFGDRCATIDTIPLHKLNTVNILAQKNEIGNNFLKKY